MKTIEMQNNQLFRTISTKLKNGSCYPLKAYEVQVLVNALASYLEVDQNNVKAHSGLSNDSLDNQTTSDLFLAFENFLDFK